MHACYAPLPAGASYRRGDWGCTTVALKVGQSTWVELSPLLPKCKENVNRCLPAPLIPGGFPDSGELL